MLEKKRTNFGRKKCTPGGKKEMLCKMKKPRNPECKKDKDEEKNLESI